MEELRVLPDFKPEPKFQVGDKVKTWKGDRLIQSHYGYVLVDEAWIPIYICVPITKKGKPDKRSEKTRTNSFHNQFNENSLSKIE